MRIGHLIDGEEFKKKKKGKIMKGRKKRKKKERKEKRKEKIVPCKSRRVDVRKLSACWKGEKVVYDILMSVSDSHKQWAFQFL